MPAISTIESALKMQSWTPQAHAIRHDITIFLALEQLCTQNDSVFSTRAPDFLFAAREAGFVALRFIRRVRQSICYWSHSGHGAGDSPVDAPEAGPACISPLA